MNIFFQFQKEFTLDTTIEELERGVSQPESVVNSRVWQNIPILMRDSTLLEEKNTHKLNRLMHSILHILNECVMNKISIVNRRLLHSSISTLLQSPALPTTISVWGDQCLVSLKSFVDGPFVLVETDEFKSIEEATLHNTQTISTQKEEIEKLSHTIATLERQNKEEGERLTNEKKDVLAEMEAMLTKEREEKKDAEEKVERANEREQATEIARRDAEVRIAQLLIEKQNAENNLKESKEREKRAEERENKANADRREAEQSRKKMEEEKKKAEADRMKMEEEKKKADEKIRSAEEGKRMAEERQRQAEEQKRQTQQDKEKLADEVKRTREDFRKARDEKEKSEREKREMAENMELMKQQLTGLPIWIGTKSIQTFDRTAHKFTPTKLTQLSDLENKCWRTAFTGPIDEGEWELKIRASETTFSNVMLGYVRHPFPKDATQSQCGTYDNGIGGDFVLWNGKLWKDRDEFKPEGTNKKCNRIGQTAAIRVNMRTREARLFVDDEKQPGIFTGIPSPLCLGVTTGYVFGNLSVEVLWLKRLRS
ncbi:hypothetical protein BLNAU_12159 [Blattamonas nauphoetae]|uniref:Uncharacterized protein n=1 Tax=Blattamonas nauphoetae TaxID=2049346 RepID=A0ABQ9XK82_9EUKA|nr:hypothetical protein BLNAU_12159 [Blattamonas nauphoetae]